MGEDAKSRFRQFLLQAHGEKGILVKKTPAKTAGLATIRCD